MIQDKVNFSSPKYKAIGKPSMIIKQGEDVVYEHHGKNAFNTDVFKLVDWVSCISESRLMLFDCKTETNPFPSNGFLDISKSLINYATPTSTSTNMNQASYNPYVEIKESRVNHNIINWVFSYNYAPEQGNGEIKSIRLSPLAPYERHIYSRLSASNFPSIINGKYGYVMSSNMITVIDQFYRVVETIELQSTSDAFVESGVDSTIYYYNSIMCHNYYKKETVYMIYARTRAVTNSTYTHIIYTKRFSWDNKTYTEFKKEYEYESSTSTYSYATAVYRDETFIFSTALTTSATFYAVVNNEIVTLSSNSELKCFALACWGYRRTGDTSWTSPATTSTSNFINDELIGCAKLTYTSSNMIDLDEYCYTATASWLFAKSASITSSSTSCIHLFDGGVCGDYYNNSTYGSNYAIPVVAAYNLPETVVKTSDQTMTITYEIEVTIDE